MVTGFRSHLHSPLSKANWELNAVLAAPGFMDQWLFSSPHLVAGYHWRPTFLFIVILMQPYPQRQQPAICGQSRDSNDRWPCGATGLCKPPFNRGNGRDEVL